MDDLDPNTKLEDVDIVHFWASVLNLKNACGERVFEKLANFALAALTLPISNAVVERAFSVMSCIKCRRRNRLQLIMLEALMRLRIHLKVITLGQPYGTVLKIFLYIEINGPNAFPGSRTVLPAIHSFEGNATKLHVGHVPYHLAPSS